MDVATPILPPLEAPLQAVAADGYAYVADVLPAPWIDRLAGEAERESMRPVPEEVGPVRQRALQQTVAIDSAAHPVVAGLADALVAAVRTLAGLGEFRPNEASFLRYEGPETGISPHRDHARHRLLVAVFTLRGVARFAVVADRAGRQVIAEQDTGPGDLWLLRAPGLDGVEDGRPLHTVGPPRRGPRLSLALRMNARRGEGASFAPGGHPGGAEAC